MFCAMKMESSLKPIKLSGFDKYWLINIFQSDTLTVECKRKDCPQLDCPRELQVFPDTEEEACCKVQNHFLSERKHLFFNMIQNFKD